MRQTDSIRSIVLPSECLECFMSGMDGWMGGTVCICIHQMCWTRYELVNEFFSEALEFLS